MRTRLWLKLSKRRRKRAKRRSLLRLLKSKRKSPLWFIRSPSKSSERRLWKNNLKKIGRRMMTTLWRLRSLPRRKRKERRRKKLRLRRMRSD